MRPILFFVFLLLPQIGFSQEGPNLTKYKEALKGPSKWTVSLGGNRSIADGEPIRMWGFDVGKDYASLLKLSLGIQFLTAPLESTRYTSSAQAMDTIERFTEFAYWKFGSEWTYYQSEKWKLSFPLSLGIGSVKIKSNSSLKQTATNTSTGSFPIDIGSNAIYYVRDWLGLKAGIGVRLALGKESMSTFTAPFYKIGIGIYPSELVQTIKFRSD